MFRRSGRRVPRGPFRDWRTVAGGQAEMLAPSDRGIRGNSHMIMQDKNNLQIADLILKWIDEDARKRSGAAK